MTNDDGGGLMSDQEARETTEPALYDAEHEVTPAARALADLVRLYELKQSNPDAYKMRAEERRAAWFTAKAVIAAARGISTDQPKDDLREVLNIEYALRDAEGEERVFSESRRDLEIGKEEGETIVWRYFGDWTSLDEFDPATDQGSDDDRG